MSTRRKSKYLSYFGIKHLFLRRLPNGDLRIRSPELGMHDICGRGYKKKDGYV